MPTLFFAPVTCALASHIALAETGADYKLRRVDFRVHDSSRSMYSRHRSLHNITSLPQDVVRVKLGSNDIRKL